METNNIDGIKKGDTIILRCATYKVMSITEKNGLYNLSLMKPDDKRLTNPRNTNGLATIKRERLNGTFFFKAYDNGQYLYGSNNFEEVIAWCYDHRYFFECDW